MEKIYDALGVLAACEKAQLLLVGGSLSSLAIAFVGMEILANRSFQSWLLSFLHVEFQAYIALFLFLLAVASLLASCVWAYDACQKYKQRSC